MRPAAVLVLALLAAGCAAAPPGPDPGPVRLVAELPILMYHEVGEPWSEAERLFVRPEDFRAQVEWLAEAAYTPVSMAALAAHWLEGAPLPVRPVVLTFDDGLVGVYHHAFPVLQELGFTGTLFIIEAMIGREHYLTEAMIAAMVAAGWEIGAHGRTHEYLSVLCDAELEDETAGVKARLEDRFRVAVTSLAYPGGAYDDRVVTAAQEAGFLTALTVHHGLASPGQGLLTLFRVRVYRADGLTGLQLNLGISP